MSRGEEKRIAELTKQIASLEQEESQEDG